MEHFNLSDNMDNGRTEENMTFRTALKRASFKLMMPHRELVKYSYHVSNVLRDTRVLNKYKFLKNCLTHFIQPMKKNTIMISIRLTGNAV